ncbi:unnamed protein product [Closterium sp. NIES-64]|nr:unnamed protein product [Closterium sp. NIES-64]
MRDPAYAKYTNKDLWVPLGFMLLGIVAVLAFSAMLAGGVHLRNRVHKVGFSVMLAGGVQLRNRVHKVTGFITKTVDFSLSPFCFHSPSLPPPFPFPFTSLPHPFPLPFHLPSPSLSPSLSPPFPIPFPFPFTSLPHPFPLPFHLPSPSLSPPSASLRTP